MVIEQVTGKRAADVFAEELFAPLGLAHTGLADAAGTLPEPHADGYVFADDVWADPALPGDQRDAAAGGTLQPTDHTSDSASSAWTAAGAYSSAAELADFFEAAVAGSLLDSDARSIWTDGMDPLGPDDADDADGVRFRFGLAEYDGYLFYSGAVPGYHALVAHSPDTKDTVVVLTNLMWSPDGSPPPTGIFETIRTVLR